MLDMMAKEKLLDVFGGADPRKWPRRFLTFDQFRRLAAEAISGPSVVRQRRSGSMAVVTFYLPRCSPDRIKFLREQVDPHTPIYVRAEFKVGVWSYLWNKFAAWARREG